MVQERRMELEVNSNEEEEGGIFLNKSSSSSSGKTVKSEDSGRNSAISEMSDSGCSNENINIDNSDEESLPASPYHNILHSRNKATEIFTREEMVENNNNKLIELQIDHVPSSSVIVPRTVPCIVLTPPTAFFNPPIPMMNFPGRLLPHEEFNPDFHHGLGSSFPSFPFSMGRSSMKECEERNDFKSENSLNLSRSCEEELERNEMRTSKKLAFGIDRILSDEKDSTHFALSTDTRTSHPVGINLKSYHSHHEDHRVGGDNYSSQCSECFFLSRYSRRIQFPSTTPTSMSPSSFPWIPPPPPTSHPSADNNNSALLSSNNFGQHLHLSSYGLNNGNFSNMSSMVSCNTSGNGRRKRSWSRAVFSNLQRKGLEKRFQLQKYITKPDRRQLAATLGLTDAQVKVWFQNRRMKWRHSKEGKQGTHVAEDPITSVSVGKK